MELLPALLPPGLDRHTDDVAEDGANRFDGSRVGVDEQVQLVTPLDLLETGRSQLEHRRTRLLGPFERDTHDHPPELCQRNALFNFSKKLSSTR